MEAITDAQLRVSQASGFKRNRALLVSKFQDRNSPQCPSKPEGTEIVDPPGVMNSCRAPGSGEMSAASPGTFGPSRETFSVSVVSRSELSRCAPWLSTFADQRKDHRYY